MPSTSSQAKVARDSRSNGEDGRIITLRGGRQAEHQLQHHRGMNVNVSREKRSNYGFRALRNDPEHHTVQGRPDDEVSVRTLTSDGHPGWFWFRIRRANPIEPDERWFYLLIDDRNQTRARGNGATTTVASLAVRRDAWAKGIRLLGKPD
jgi:hypothetical protein